MPTSAARTASSALSPTGNQPVQSARTTATTIGTTTAARRAQRQAPAWRLTSALVRSDVALGHGRRETISDIVFVHPREFDRSRASQAALAIDAINRNLRDQGRHCILIGPGRWGSRDPWLGIPVTWPQISTARAIVEADFDDLQVDSSFGSHFFHNLTCYGIAFFAVHGGRDHGTIDWAWFERQQAVDTALDGAIRHLRLERPAHVLVDGASGHGVILEGADP